MEVVASVLWRVGKPSVLLSFSGLVLTLAQPWIDLPLYLLHIFFKLHYLAVLSLGGYAVRN